MAALSPASEAKSHELRHAATILSISHNNFVRGGYLMLVTSGNGVNDLQLGLQNIPAGTTQGYFLLSFLTSLPQGQGPVVGLWPDAVTLTLLQTPAAQGNPIHWLWPVNAPLFPATPLLAPPGGVNFPLGTSLDGVGVALGPQSALLGITDVERVVF